MKTVKFFTFALLAGALMVGCKEKNPPVVDGGDDNPQEIVLPDVADPGAGKVAFAIHIPANSECNGIYFKGTLDGSSWTGTDEYIGETDVHFAAEEAIRFMPIEGEENWYSAVFTLGAAGLEGKVCLKYTGDKSWEGQMKNVSIYEEGTTAAWEWKDDNLKVSKETFGVIYLEIGKWNLSECAVYNEAGKATWEMTSDCIPEGAKVGIAGKNLGDGLADFDLTTGVIWMEYKDGKWIAEQEVLASCQYKYILQLADEKAPTWDYACKTINGETIGQLDNLDMPVSLQVVDEVTEWNGFAPVEVPDYSNCEVELVGDAVAVQEGSADDTVWKWGQVLTMGKPVVSDNAYTWTLASVNLLATGGFKIRTLNGDASGDIEKFDCGGSNLADGSDAIESTGNIVVSKDGNYSVTLSIDREKGKKVVTIKAL